MTRIDLNNRNRCTWWYPQIPKEIPMPKHEFICYDFEDDEENSLVNLLDGKTPPRFKELCGRIKLAGDRLGWPIFLKTDYLSGKHNWQNTCFISKPEEIASHIYNIVSTSYSADLWGFPTDRWVAREIIPVEPVFFAFDGGMPIVKERRYFVNGLNVLCHHPYWPKLAFKNKTKSSIVWEKRLEMINQETQEEIDLLSKLSGRVGAAIDGEWSVDWLWSEPRQQWYMIDMAEADCSYHWPECERIEK